MPGTDAPEWMISSETLDELAEKLDLNANNFVNTVGDFNKYVDSGNDKDFSRGQSEYDSFYGDRSQEGVFSTLGKLNKPPILCS